MLIVTVLLVAVAHGSVFRLRNETLQGDRSSPFFSLMTHLCCAAGREQSWRFGLVTQEEQPQISFLYSPSDQAIRPVIFSQLTFTVAAEVLQRTHPRVDVLVYHSRNRFRLGVDRMGKKEMCCTTELFNAGKCSRLGQVLMEGQMLGSGTDGSYMMFPVILNQ